MNVLALGLAVVSLPFCLWLWKGVKREIGKSLTEADVRLGIRPARRIEVMAKDPDDD